MNPPAKPKERRQAFTPDPVDIEDVGRALDEKVLDVDPEGHLRWLETGTGEPWPPASRS